MDRSGTRSNEDVRWWTHWISNLIRDINRLALVSAFPHPNIQHASQTRTRPSWSVRLVGCVRILLRLASRSISGGEFNTSKCQHTFLGAAAFCYASDSPSNKRCVLSRLLSHGEGIYYWGTAWRNWWRQFGSNKRGLCHGCWYVFPKVLSFLKLNFGTL